MPLAIEYGMTPKQFWEDEIELFYVYQKAYINRVHKQAHITGLYINMALNTTFANMFKKKDAQALEYPKDDVFNPFNENNKHDKEKSYISSIDTTKNNNGIYQIKKLIEERRKISNV